MEEQNKNEVISLRTFFPYIGSFIIFLGVLRLVIFYNDFGVSIVSYLDFQEIITSFLDIIVLSILFTIFSLLQGFYTRSRKSLDEQAALRDQIIGEPDGFKRFLLYFRFCAELIIGGLFILLVYFIWYLCSGNISGLTFVWIGAFYIVAFLIAILLVEMDVKHNKLEASKETRRLNKMLFCSILFAMLVILSAHLEADSIRKDKKNTGVTVFLDDDEKIVSDSTNYYIGKTQNFIFIFSELENSTRVIPVTRIKQMIVQKKKIK